MKGNNFFLVVLVYPSFVLLAGLHKPTSSRHGFLVVSIDRSLTYSMSVVFFSQSDVSAQKNLSYFLHLRVLLLKGYKRVCDIGESSNHFRVCFIILHLE